MVQSSEETGYEIYFIPVNDKGLDNDLLTLNQLEAFKHSRQVLTQGSELDTLPPLFFTRTSKKIHKVLC